MRLSGACEDGALVQLWLTRRLADRLLPLLLNWLGQQAGEGAHAEVMQEFAQQAAREALAPLPSVRAQDDSSMLVQAVDVTTGDNALGLAFKAGGPSDEAGYRIGFEAQALRQWLGILHDQYRKAEWPVDAWPSWITSAGQPASAGVPLH
ncbi:MAG TPA: hypothetical protein VGE60_09635 [Telluria sp.]